MKIFNRKEKLLVTCEECGTILDERFAQKLQLFRDYYLGDGLQFIRYFYLCDRHKKEKAYFGMIENIGHRVKKMVYYKKVQL